MPKSILMLATPREIRDIAARAMDGLRAFINEEAEEDDDRPANKAQAELKEERFRGLIDALRFCARAAALSGDVSLLPVITDMINVLWLFNEEDKQDLAALVASLTRLLSMGAQVDESIAKLAQHEDGRVRHAVAVGLSPRDPRAIAILERLADDPFGSARTEARKKLVNVRSLTWWQGKFASDPTAKLSKDEALRYKHTFERISTLLDMEPPELSRHHDELVEHVSALPDTLALELAVSLFTKTERYGSMPAALGTMVLTRPGGTSVFLRLCAKWSRRSDSYKLSELALQSVQALPLEARVRVLKELLAHVTSQPDEVRYAKDNNAAEMVARVVGKAWPPGEDLTPVLDALLTLPPAPDLVRDQVVFALDSVFRAPHADPTPFLDRAIEACIAGYPGSWKNVALAMDVLLARAPVEVLRPAAERALHSEAESALSWGMTQLLTRAFDPSRDPPRPELVRRLFAVPAYRRALLATWAVEGLTAPLLREELRAGRLELPDALKAVRIITSLYGGSAVSPYLSPKAPEEQEERARLKKREPIEDSLGPPELRGPPTDEEWSMLRAARARHSMKENPLWHAALTTLPPGPFSPEDRVLLDDALRACVEGERELAWSLALALSAKPEVEHLGLFRRLHALAEPDDRECIERCEEIARDALGVPPPPSEDGDEGFEDKDPAPDSGAQAPKEWMDEPEE